MINSDFYTVSNTARVYLEGKVPHFIAKDPTITLEQYPYTIKLGETIYSIAEKVFGKGLGHLWTIIADNNPPRMPDDWAVGDVVYLPRVILKDSIQKVTSYEGAQTVSTAVLYKTT